MSTHYRYTQSMVKDLARTLGVQVLYDMRYGYSIGTIPARTAREAMAVLWGYQLGRRAGRDQREAELVAAGEVAS